VKIYVIIVETVKKKERQGETQFTKKIDSFLNFSLPTPGPRPLMLMFFF
jgi:hypothetical protein